MGPPVAAENMSNVSSFRGREKSGSVAARCLAPKRGHLLWLPPAAPSRLGLVLAEPRTASGRTPQPKALRGQAGPYEHSFAMHEQAMTEKVVASFSFP